MKLWTTSLIKGVLSIQHKKYTTMSAKRVAVCQMTSVADKTQNMLVVSQLISQAAKDNVQMMFFPEACDFICDSKKETLNSAESILTGKTVQKYRELALKHNVWLSMGGVHEKNEVDETKIFNSHIIIDNKGDIVQTYRKLHLFDVEIPEKNVRLKESDFCTPGCHIVSPVESPVGKIGMSICYDMRFPELSTSLSILNAEILTFPSAFTYATGVAHWHILLRARAIENQCYVIAAAQAGHHNAKRRSYGHALGVSPWGEVLADCEAESPSYKVIEIGDCRGVRRNMPVFQHRRSDVYSLYALSVRKSLLADHTTKSLPDDNRTPETSEREPMNVFGHVKVPDSCVFYKTELTYAFVNLRCVIPGHVLVAPLRVAERNQDLSDEEAEDFYRTIRLVQRLMENVHKTHSCTVTIQDGVDAGQTVKHLHCHILPRKKGDFIDNDLIYLELAKHDQFSSKHPSKPPRTLQVMRTEASMLKEKLHILMENR